ncbi:MAG: 5-formyltetrahydrofolate cyclo-ligase [Pseudomonadota bacterium]
MPESPAAEVSALRSAHRRARAALPESRQQRNAERLADRLSALPAFRSARTLAGYCAVRGEISLEPVLHIAAELGKVVHLPILRDGTMAFAPWTPGAPLERRDLGLLEPHHDPSARVPPADIDLVLAPLVVFDDHCQRIGQGGGFYDRSFAFRLDPAVRTPVLIGVAHDMQREARLRPMPWDVPLDMIATEQQLYIREDALTP